MVAEQKHCSPRGRALQAPREGSPPLSPQAAAKFPSPAWELFGRIWSDSGAGLGAHFKAALRGRAGGAGSCWCQVLPQLPLWRFCQVLGVGAACRAWVQRGADFCFVTERRSCKEPCMQVGKHGLCCLARACRRRLSISAVLVLSATILVFLPHT